MTAGPWFFFLFCFNPLPLPNTHTLPYFKLCETRVTEEAGVCRGRLQGKVAWSANCAGLDLANALDKDNPNYSWSTLPPSVQQLKFT